MILKESFAEIDMRHSNSVPKSIKRVGMEMNSSSKGYRPHRKYDSLKHVSHNRNHTIPGVGRHS